MHCSSRALEFGGFREIDFLRVGDDAVVLTPNVHAHYTDHGALQVCRALYPVSAP